MSGIESNILPFASTIGFGGIVGFLIGFMLQRIMKILAVLLTSSSNFNMTFFLVILYVNDVKNEKNVILFYFA